MYCPHCGTQNLPDTKFCRGCGEDLRLVSQAFTKSLSLVIAHRVDEAIDRGRGGWRSYQVFRNENRRPFAQLLMSLSGLFVVVWMLMLGHGSVSFAGGFLLVMTLALLITSAQDLWNRKQRRRSEEPDELPASLTTRELGAAPEMPEASVTEPTTRKLKVEAGHSPGKN
ncbi:MAG: zinc-ribbon domain [Pyrinomonadaceae bacterium]|jgi:Flp pilus assembly protein TadB|nr:zinc-ribbon domain [Pyrinomonadaceae bacterium]